MPGQWIESVTDWEVRIANWHLPIHRNARLAAAVRPMPNNDKTTHPGFPIALVSRLPDWAVQSVLPIATSRLFRRFYPLASDGHVRRNPAVVKSTTP